MRPECKAWNRASAPTPRPVMNSCATAGCTPTCTWRRGPARPASARVVLQGPASMELLGGNSARLLRGKLTAQVPASAKGFQITSPQGKIVDLGTEFGMAVARDGTTDVYVFKGKVEAYASASGGANAGLNVLEKQAARIDASGVALQAPGPKSDPDQYVRAIVP